VPTRVISTMHMLRRNNIQYRCARWTRWFRCLVCLEAASEFSPLRRFGSPTWRSCNWPGLRSSRPKRKPRSETQCCRRSWPPRRGSKQRSSKAMRKDPRLLNSSNITALVLVLKVSHPTAIVAPFPNSLSRRDIMVSDNMKFNGDFEATVDDS